MHCNWVKSELLEIKTLKLKLLEILITSLFTG